VIKLNGRTWVASVPVERNSLDIAAIRGKNHFLATFLACLETCSWARMTTRKFTVPHDIGLNDRRNSTVVTIVHSRSRNDS
jgi:hypothetical protein